MADRIVVRCVEPSEAAVLRVVATDVFDHEVEPGYLRAFLGDPHSLLAVALDDGTVVGMASGLVHGHPDKPWQLFVNEVGVAPTHRRRGLARSLVRCLLERGRELGCIEAWVATDEGNLAARALYRATGGRESDDMAVVYTYPLEPEGTDREALRSVALRSEALLSGASEAPGDAGGGPDAGGHASVEPAGDDAGAKVLMVKRLVRGADELRFALAPIESDDDWAAYAEERVRVEANLGAEEAAARRMVEAMRRRAATMAIRWCFVWARGERVGAVGLLAFDGGEAGRLQDVEVFPRFRGHGFGRWLLGAIEAEAAASGCRLLVVGADRDDWPLGWYGRNGYVEVAAVRHRPA